MFLFFISGDANDILSLSRNPFFFGSIQVFFALKIIQLNMYAYQQHIFMFLALFLCAQEMVFRVCLSPCYRESNKRHQHVCLEGVQKYRSNSTAFIFFCFFHCLILIFLGYTYYQRIYLLKVYFSLSDPGVFEIEGSPQFNELFTLNHCFFIKRAKLL